MGLRYGCLIIDHDDTVVDSTAMVHFPSYLKVMKQLRPGVEPVDLDGWFLKNFHPGVFPYFIDELGFTAEEMEAEYKIWRSHGLTLRPQFFAGIIDLLARYSKHGGKIAVVSHSEKDIIERDYRETGEGIVTPDIIFGWEMEEGRRKPNPWPVYEVMRRLSVSTDDILVVDDLKPAVMMAHSAGVDIAGVGWAHQVPEIVDYMKSNCDYYCKTIGDLEAVVFT